MPLLKFVFKAWNDKILDYEIETVKSEVARPHNCTWNDKILDYEIETGMLREKGYGRNSGAWNDKILDYEIETTP